MSLENNIASIAKSLERIATVMEKGSTPAAPAATEALGNLVQAAAVATAPVVAAPTVALIANSVATPTPTVTAPSVVTADTPSINTMPVAPTFAAPAPALTTTTAPFSDAKGLVDYVMAAYKTMGPEKGAGIQSILVGLGYQNINDVKPEHYAELHKKIEALK